jgi:hypothetical protein
MVKLGIVTMVAFAAMIASALADEQVWVVDNWPADSAKIPCSAWSKTADGGWALTGGAVKLGSETLDNIGVKGDAAARMLDRRCGSRK